MIDYCRYVNDYWCNVLNKIREISTFLRDIGTHIDKGGFLIKLGKSTLLRILPFQSFDIVSDEQFSLYIGNESIIVTNHLRTYADPVLYRVYRMIWMIDENARNMVNKIRDTLSQLPKTSIRISYYGSIRIICDECKSLPRHVLNLRFIYRNIFINIYEREDENIMTKYKEHLLNIDYALKSYDGVYDFIADFSDVFTCISEDDLVKLLNLLTDRDLYTFITRIDDYFKIIVSTSI